MSWRRHFFGVAACLALAACGFQLRGAANYAFESIFVGAPPGLPFTIELKRALANAGNAKVLDAAQGAQVVLDISGISDDKSVLSLSPGGRAREFLLVKRVTFSLRGADGAQWLPQDQITVQRSGQEPLNIKVDDQTKVTIDGKPGSASDLKSGGQVSVQYVMKNGQPVATMIAAHAGTPSQGMQQGSQPTP